MATAIIVGIAAYGAVAGSVAVGTAVAIGVAATAAAYMAEKALEPDNEQSQAVQIGDRASQADKSSIQQEAQLGKLELGESAKEKKKRKKGKAAFKIDLDKRTADTAQATTGVQVPDASTPGVQL